MSNMAQPAGMASRETSRVVAPAFNSCAIIAPDGSTTDITAGWLRASQREVEEAGGRPGTPLLQSLNRQAVPIGEPVNYRIPLVPNARRFAVGHRIRLLLTSDDQPDEIPAIMGFRHAPVGTTTRNAIHSASRLRLPITSAAGP